MIKEGDIFYTCMYCAKEFEKKPYKCPNCNKFRFRMVTAGYDHTEEDMEPLIKV